MQRVSLGLAPINYKQDFVTMQPNASANVLVPLFDIPFGAHELPGIRTSKKVFLQGLTIRWELIYKRVYQAGNTPTKVRFGIVRARGCELKASDLQFNPTEIAAGVVDTDAIWDHKQVKVIMDRTVTMGDDGAFQAQGYKHAMNMKTFTKHGRQITYDSASAFTTPLPLHDNWYLFAISSGTLAPMIGASDMNVLAQYTLSYKNAP